MVLFHLPVSPPVSGMIIGASVHGLTDLYLPPKTLLPYSLLLFHTSIPSLITTGMFAIASMYHFGLDIGLRKSILLNLSLGIIALVDLKTSVFFMSVYYLLYHIPLHVIHNWRNGRRRVAFLITLCILLCSKIKTNVIILNNALQLLIVAHSMTHYIVDNSMM